MQETNLLIVDDAPLNRELLACILGEQYCVYQAENGAQAIEMIRSRERIYRLMLLDIQMPEVDGFGVLEYLNRNQLVDTLPVIVISGDSSYEAILRAYKLGAVDYFSKPFSAEIIRNRVHNTLSLYRHDYTDLLTGGYNRRGFVQMAQNILFNTADASNLALLYLDIKNFRATNDLFGTDGGDSVLREFYGKMNSIWSPLVSGRMNTDHFACLISWENLDLEAMETKLKITAQRRGRSMRLYAHCGVYNLRAGETDVPAMLEKARMAQESVLSDCLQPYAVFDDSIRQMYMDRVEIMGEYETAIANGEFKVYYQPVVEAATGNLVSAEALVRWEHPEKGMVSPAVFIPALESGGQISRLDGFVAERVFQNILKCREEDIPVVPVSVNLSWMDFYNEELMDKLVDIFQGDALLPGDMRLEITETSYVALENERAGLMEQLRSAGALILLDDFGSGYSSFGMLKRYDFDILKLDMSFTRQIETSPKVRTIINGILDMAHHLGIRVIAEGVETAEQVTFLRNNDCDYIQGYYYSRPLTEDEFQDYVCACAREGRLGTKAEKNRSTTTLYRRDDTVVPDNHLTQKELQAMLRNFQMVFDVVQLRNRQAMEQLCTAPDHETQCCPYCDLDRQGLCPAVRAYRTRAEARQTRLYNGAHYESIARYLEVDGEPYVLELLHKIPDVT